MNKEIKARNITQQAIDVLNDLKKLKPGNEYEAGMPVDIMASALLDYITNLQTIEQQYSAILSENAELENKIINLQEENKESEEAVKYWQNQCDLKQMAIDKAVDYINIFKDDIRDLDEYVLLYILKGSDKE